MNLKVTLNTDRKTSKVSPLTYGHFAEHFHRQIYGGIYAPGSDLSDEDGFRGTAKRPGVTISVNGSTIYDEGRTVIIADQ